MSKRTNKENEPYIDKEFIGRVNWVIDDSILHDETWKRWEHDTSKEMERDLSKLRRIVENFTKPDFAAVVITAMENYPYMVLQIVAEYIEHLTEGGR